MVDFLHDDIAIEGEVTTKAELIANGILTVGPGGTRYGQPASELSNSWVAHTRIQVANVAERALLVAWRAANDPISPTRPLLVWRADGSSTGLEEVTTDGVNWYAQSPMPGDIEMTIASTAPYGWVLMQGQLLADAATNYPALWALADPILRVGAHLRIPDMQGRVPMGAGESQSDGLTLRTLGNAHGSELATLTTANLPAHTHTGETNGTDRSLNHKHWTKFDHVQGDNIAGTDYQYEVNNPSGGTIHDTSTVSSQSDPQTQADLNHKHSFTTASTGSGTGHNNIQPSRVLNFKVKV